MARTNDRRDPNFYKGKDGEEGVWRTIGGRRVFIKNGQNLADAMKESGKFSRVQKNQELYKKLDEENKKEEKGKEEYSFAEIVDEMERAEDYSDLYSASEKIADKDLRKEVEDAISQAESDGFEVSEAYSTITSDYLDTKARQGEKNTSSSEKYNEFGSEDYVLDNKGEPYRDNKGNVVTRKEYGDFRDAYKQDKISKEDYKSDNYDAIRKKENKNISSNEAVNELMSADVGDWNNMNQTQRDKQCEKILNDFENKYGDKLKDDKFRKEVLDDLEDQNFHTMGKVIEQKYENSNNKELKDLDNRIKEASGGYPRAKGAKDFSDYGIGPMEEWSTDWEKEFSDYLRDKYGTDDIDIITTGSERTPNSLEEDFMKQYKEKKDTLNYKTRDEVMRENGIEFANEEMAKGGFVQENTQHGGTREYSAEEVKRMEDNGIRPMKRSYSGYGWEGVNSKQNLTTSEQAKAITDAMKKKYPDVKVARKSDVYSGGSSIDFNIMSSDKDIFISDKDIDKLGSEQLYNTEITRGYGFDRWAEDNVPSYKTEHTFTVNDVKRYAKEQLAEMKKHDIRATGNEWFLNDYGKKVVSDLNKEANSYTFDDSDGMIDYFHHGTYMDVYIGKWDKPYEVKGNSMTSALKNKAYQKYLKEHPSSKMTLAEFKKMNK